MRLTHNLVSRCVSEEDIVGEEVENIPCVVEVPCGIATDEFRPVVLQAQELVFEIWAISQGRHRQVHGHQSRPGDVEPGMERSGIGKTTGGGRLGVG